MNADNCCDEAEGGRGFVEGDEKGAGGNQADMGRVKL